MANKVSRNDPCSCGSGKKFKRCCLDKQQAVSLSFPADVRHEFEKMQAIQDQIEKQQGLGRPIVSFVFKGYRFVASGPKLHWDKEERWRTFHDFLSYYFKHVFGKEWGLAELKKTFEEQHPIIQWHVKVIDYMKTTRQEGHEIQTAPMTGAAFALLNLSYNLFLLEHNVTVQETLIKRLKSPDRGIFHGALYETYVAAIFIRAGFKLEMENEADPTESHCEFTAIAPSGNKYSVEAKARQPFKESLGIGSQLGKALKKKALYKRVVFIDVNIPKLRDKWTVIDKELKEKEDALAVEGQPAPPAYVFITNHSFAYDLENTKFERMGFASGFKIDYFRADTAYMSLRDARLARDKHMDMVNLVKSMKQQDRIPVTFDGDIPEFAFNKELKIKRLLIGEKYLVPTQAGKEGVGILESATVSIPEKLCYGSYHLQDGSRAICACSMSDEEIEVYKKYPDTFFGVLRQQGRKIDDPLEFFDFMYESYKETLREKLLEFIKDWADAKDLEKLDTEALRIEYCERCTYSAMQHQTVKNNTDHKTAEIG